MKAYLCFMATDVGPEPLELRQVGPFPLHVCCTLRMAESVLLVTGSDHFVEARSALTLCVWRTLTEFVRFLTGIDQFA